MRAGLIAGDAKCEIYARPPGSSSQRSGFEVFDRLKSQIWYFFDSGVGAPAENMAVDETLLELAPSHGAPVLRFYGWSEGAASFGYSQHYAEIQRWTALRPLIRRPTGGGLVPHDRDWTYSVVIPPSHEWYSLKAIQSYKRVHEWLQFAFAKLGLETQLAPGALKDAQGRCFLGAEQFDLLWKGRKIAGAAQRRNRHGLLIQGSIQPPLDFARATWEQAMREVLAMDGSVEWRSFEPSAQVRIRATALALSKYSQAAYNQRR